MSLTVDHNLDRAAWEEGEYLFRRVWCKDHNETCVIGWLVQDGNMWRWGLHAEWMGVQGGGFHDFTKILSDPLPEPEAVATMYAVWRMKYGGKA